MGSVCEVGWGWVGFCPICKIYWGGGFCPCQQKKSGGIPSGGILSGYLGIDIFGIDIPAPTPEIDSQNDISPYFSRRFGKKDGAQALFLLFTK